jgi:carotenoid cleavage dioxygenase-like enzyme
MYHQFEEFLKDIPAAVTERRWVYGCVQQETAAGRALFDKFGDSKGPLYLGLLAVQSLRRMLGLMDFSQGRYLANTALLWHAGQLWALHEGEQPHLLTVEPNGAITMVSQPFTQGILKQVTDQWGDRRAMP